MMTFFYETNDDGHCEFDTLAEAVGAAQHAAAREGHRVPIYGPEGKPVTIAAPHLPNAAERNCNPERYGYDD